MTRGIEDRLYRIISDVFGVPVEEVSEDTSPDTVENWDSLSHLNLILSLEEEFGVSFSPEDTMEMLSVQLICTILAEHSVTGS